jgi:hypothetical protein
METTEFADSIQKNNQRGGFSGLFRVFERRGAPIMRFKGSTAEERQLHHRVPNEKYADF